MLLKCWELFRDRVTIPSCPYPNNFASDMMFIHYTNSLSAHQLPLDEEIVKRIGAENFRYVYTNEMLQGGAQEVRSDAPWIEQTDPASPRTRIMADLETCDWLLVGGLRPIGLMERRIAAGKATFYMSERWFKPLALFDLRLFDCLISVVLPGWLRLFHPRYFRMARRFARLFNSPCYRYLPIGPWAAKDMRFVQGIMRFFGMRQDAAAEYLPWGDFVAPSCLPPREDLQTSPSSPLKVLSIGRLLKLKHVETIVKAVGAVRSRPISLTIVGSGPEETALRKLTAGKTNIVMKPAVRLDEVRQVMRAHDVLVFASNATDGWGATVQEALTEGVPVLGTYEAGASAALLPEAQLFHCGDWRCLSRLLADFNSQTVLSQLPLDYSPKGAAERLIKEYRSI